MNDIQEVSKTEAKLANEMSPALVALVALKKYKDVLISGLAVAGILALFRYVSGGTLGEFLKFEQGLTKHALQLPMLLVDMAIFIGGFTLAVSGPWGPWLQKHIIKPILEFLLHNFGVAAGFILVVWATDPASRTATSGLEYFGFVLFVELLLLLFGFVLAIGAHVCEHGVAWLITGQDLKYLGPRLRSVSRYIPLPAGGIVMWLAYQDIIRLSMHSTIGH